MFQPTIPLGGYAGWAFLSRTKEKQQAAFEHSPVIERETRYFEKNIGKIRTAEELVSDRTLLKVALGAFGLDDDINSKAFIRKILEDGTLTTDALANKLSDKRYLAFSKAFGFGDFAVPRTGLSEFGAEITGLFKARSFEKAVGDQNGDLRLALSLQRDLKEIADKKTSVDTKWYSIMGQPPLRKVFETAFGLPSSYATIDLDTQLKGFKDRAERTFGSADISQFTDPAKQEKLIRLFLVRSEAQAFTAGAVRGQTALALLQGVGR